MPIYKVIVEKLLYAEIYVNASSTKAIHKAKELPKETDHNLWASDWENTGVEISEIEELEELPQGYDLDFAVDEDGNLV